MNKIKLNFGAPTCQEALLTLQQEELVAIFRSFKKISKMTWQQLYEDSGLKWEAIITRHTSLNQRMYSFRFSQKYRATAMRNGDTLSILGLHTDHDSAYH